MRRLMALLFLCAHLVLPAEIPIVTVCEAVRDRRIYAGKDMIVVGELSWTDEGIWLGQKCQDLSVDGKSIDGTISLISRWPDAPPPRLPAGFVWKQGLLRKKLEQVKTTTKLRPMEHDSWHARYGRLETKLGYSDDEAGTPRLVSAVSCNFGPKGMCAAPL